MKINLQKKDVYAYVFLTLSLISTFWFISLFELYASKANGVSSSLGMTIVFKLLNDFWAGIIIGLLMLPIYLFFKILIKKGASTAIKIVFVILVAVQFGLVKYSVTTLINLGADILGYSFDDVFSTVSVSESISITYFLPFVIFPLLFFLVYFLIKKHLNERMTIGVGVLFILLFGTLKLVFSESSDDVYQNKIAYLTTDIIKFQSDKNKISAYNLFDRNDYPLLKSSAKVNDVLSPFLDSKEDKPNIVVIVVEGLGSEFVNGNTYSEFTPYFDSLISKSLYWENFVSTTGRSFGILPSLFGSLPYGEKGFLELTDIPSHISLISVLKANEYQTSYYSGGPSSFDRKINFLEYNGVDKLIDENKYGPDYMKTAGNSGGFSWGYPDSEIFRKAIASFETEKQPRLDIVMTLSMHEPFAFPRKEAYMAKVDEILNTSRKPDDLKNAIINQKEIFSSILYTDTAIKGFMEAYEQRPDYENTIFIITGDHRLIPVTQKDKLCRFHVPFLIYSPMLKHAEKFKSVSSHWDVTPSILSHLMNNYKFKPLEKVAWMGKGLDTVRQFRNVNQIPLMRYKGSLNDMIYKDYLYADGELFKIKENFGTYKVVEEELTKAISDSLLEFKKMNAYVTQRNKIFPDSLNIYIKPKMEFTPEQLVIIDKHSKEKTFDELLFIARDFSFNKKYKTAKILCDYILNEFPNYTDARILKGRTLAWEGKYKESEASLISAMQRSPYYYDSYLAILDMYWWSGQDEKAIGVFSKALKNNLTNAEISYKMAKAHQRMNNLEQANKIMDSIIDVHPNNPEYKTFKGTLK